MVANVELANRRADSRDGGMDSVRNVSEPR